MGSDDSTGHPIPEQRQLLFEALRHQAEPLEAGGNRPFSLEAAQAVWLVETGKVEIFAVRQGGSEERGAQRTHIRTVPAGQMIFGLERKNRRLPFGSKESGDGETTDLQAVGSSGTRVLRIELARLRELARQEELVPVLAELLEQWVVGLYRQISRAEAPRDFTPLEAGAECHLEEGGKVARTRAGVLWVRHVMGRSDFLGRSELAMASSGPPLPLSDETWLVSRGEVRLSPVETVLLLRSGGVWEGLATFHRLFLDYVDLLVAKAAEEDREQLERRIRIDDRVLQGAYRRLASVLGGERPVLDGVGEVGDGLFLACRLVAEAQGITLRKPGEAVGSQGDPLQKICAASRIRYRSVLLRDDWWRRDNGPLLAYRRVELPSEGTVGEGGEKGGGEVSKRPAFRRVPVALLPSSATRYEMVEPIEGSRTPVDEQLAESLEGMATMFYTPLPERPLTAGDLVRSAFHGLKGDLVLVALMGLGGGLLATITPVLTGHLFGRAIPNSDQQQVLQMTAALVVSALASGIFQIVRGVAVLRIGGKMDGSLQAAVWDRLMSLPVTFFRRYRVGDLANRSLAIDTIRGLVTGNFTASLLSGVFSVFSFALLFYYSLYLALLASVLVLVMVVVTAVLSYLQVKYQRRQLEVEGRISSLLFGLMSGISKLRIGGAERRAFARWAEQFSEQRRQAISVRKLAIVQSTFISAYRLLGVLALFAMMGYSSTIELPVSDFLAFNAAFGQFQAASLSIIGLLPSVLMVVPLYERLEPILEAVPEVDEAKAEVHELSGDIELSHVSFRYQPDGPLILDDVSFHVRPGELVALVGPSGSGKSTCLRLILGFDRPGAGSIYFDGQDIQSLDIQSLRRQIGVVLQNGRPSSGTLFSNIVGSTNLGHDAAWEAARMAGLAEDIDAMPMKMHTVVSEGAGTFSGGQVQRLMIARAVVHKPRILLFDEATSALDNQTQEVVSQSLANLKATRIAVAHRLSTIESADRIIVIDGGRVVEEGTYEELLELGGVFARMAERQMA